MGEVRITKKLSEGCEGVTTRMNLWCALPQHLLELILGRIPLEDHERFACVCRWWRAVEKQTHISPLPWVMLKPNSRLEEGKVMSFFSLFDGQIKHINFPIPVLNLHKGKSCCRGWILMEDCHWGMRSLANPITRKRIYVPPAKGTGTSFCLAPDPATPNDVILLRIQRECVGIFQPSRNISEWREIALQRRKLRAISGAIGGTACKSKLYFLDHKRNLTVLDMDNGEMSLLKLKNGEEILDGIAVFLVDSCGDVLLVSVYSWENDEADGKHVLYRFDVFKADLDAMLWVKVKRLGNQMLFLSRRSSFSIDAMAGFKGNKIYYLPSLLVEEFDHWIEFDLESGICVAGLLPNNRCGSSNTWQWLMPIS